MFQQARDWLPRSLFGSGVVGAVATVGVVAAGAAVIEAALIPGLLLGGAAVLAPRLLRRETLGGWRFGEDRSEAPPAPAAAAVDLEQATPETDSARFDTGRAVVKTVTYRAIVTTVDFGANYFVIGELALAAGLSSMSLVAGPIFYFAHEAAWHYYGPASARLADPLEAAVEVPLPRAAEAADEKRPRIVGLRVSRAFAKTVTYEGVTAVSEFSVNYLFVRDLAAAAGLTAFSVLISPFIYYAHEKAWDYYDATKARAPKLLAPPKA